MRKFKIGVAIGALAISVALVPVAAGKPGGVPGGGPKGPKGPKQAATTVSLTATPSTVDAATASITATGNVFANSGCRKDRTVRFSYVSAGGTTPLAVTAVSGPNGDFTAVLPKPTDTGPATVTLNATADEAIRKVGSKKKGKKNKKGRQFLCLSGTGSATLTVPAPPAP